MKTAGSVGEMEDPLAMDSTIRLVTQGIAFNG